MNKLLPTLLLACAPLAQAQDAFKPIAWLAGCWAQQGREAGSAEQWMAPAGGLGTAGPKAMGCEAPPPGLNQGAARCPHPCAGKRCNAE